MAVAATSRLWFPEPASPDLTYARRGEETWSWLRRSTVGRAFEFRRFLNLNLSKLPEDTADRIHTGLRTSWRAYFFELIVARTLQVLGGQVVFEPSIGGRKPDFRATFSCGRAVVVKATSPIIRKNVQDRYLRAEQVAEIIESFVPPGWMVSIRKVPALGPADSKKELKGVLSRLLNMLPPTSRGTVELKEQLSSGSLRLSLIPNDRYKTKIAAMHLPGWMGDGTESIRRAIKQKRRQVRESKDPVILAINGHEAISEMEDFDMVLFGGSYQFRENGGVPGGREYVGTGGEFHARGRAEPKIAAVLAFLQAGFYCSHEPVLYRHPRQTVPLPDEFEIFEQRSFVNGRGVVRNEARNRSVLQALVPIRRPSDATVIVG